MAGVSLAVSDEKRAVILINVAEVSQVCLEGCIRLMLYPGVHKKETVGVKCCSAKVGTEWI